MTGTDFLLLINATFICIVIFLLQLAEVIKKYDELYSCELSNQENVCLQLTQLKVSLFV